MATMFGCWRRAAAVTSPRKRCDLLARELPGQNHLERDNAPEAGLPSAIDHTHPAPGNLFEQFVVAEVPNRPTFGFRCSMFAFSQERLSLVGARDLRFRQRFFQPAFEQAPSAEALGVLRAQFGPAAGA